ncbi:MAG: phosphatase PAP2 family protein [Myxococcota bacterium]
MSKAFAKILNWDASLLLYIRGLERNWLTPVMRVVTRLGNAEMWLVLGFTLASVGGTATEAGLRLGMAALLGTFFAQILKRSCKRERPNLRIEGFTALSENPDHFSFPSGHTTTAVSVAVALFDQGVLLGPLAMGFASVIAVSRVYLGAHYPLDVGVGALIGTCTGLIVRFVFGA